MRVIYRFALVAMLLVPPSLPQVRFPIAGPLTSDFGLRLHPIFHIPLFHWGWDIGCPMGTPVRAAMDGAVDFVGRNGGYGNFIRITHAGSLATVYGHLDKFAPGIRRGTKVKAGDIIGTSGNSGLSTGPHAHVEVLRYGIPINPRDLFCAIHPAITPPVKPLPRKSAVRKSISKRK